MKRSRLSAVLSQRCPECREGKVFRGLFQTAAACPHCGLVFEREPGYFLGAMYISYGMGALILGPTALLGTLVMDWSLGKTVLVSVGLLILTAPLVFRYSRVVFLHFERMGFLNWS